MRRMVIALAATLAAPAFAQETRAPQTPPPEGFYRNIDGAYDLLFRPYSYSDIQLVRTPRSLATPLPPPCEPPPIANTPAAKPPGPAPCQPPR